jgi:hypothetical protein
MSITRDGKFLPSSYRQTLLLDSDSPPVQNGIADFLSAGQGHSPPRQSTFIIEKKVTYLGVNFGDYRHQGDE